MRNVDVLVGLSFGSEGKGHLAQIIAEKYDIAVRTGSPNAGHTTWHGSQVNENERKYAWQTIPCVGVDNRDCHLVIGAGGMIFPDVLEREIEWLKQENVWDEDRLLIDPKAGIIEKHHMEEELGGGMVEHIGSTAKGCGSALSAKVWRGKPGHTGIRLVEDLAKDEDLSWICNYMQPTARFLNEKIDAGAEVLLEGTQGIMLSLHHSYYPYCTSRDTGPASWCSEAGISPTLVRDVYGVMRTYPIRVHGNSGPTDGNELSWEDVTKLSGSPTPLVEQTTVTKKVRRVFYLGEADFKKALMICRPTVIGLTFVDYISYADYQKIELSELSPKSLRWISDFRKKFNINDELQYLFTGPKRNDCIRLDKGDLDNIASVNVSLGT